MTDDAATPERPTPEPATRDAPASSGATAETPTPEPHAARPVITDPGIRPVLSTALDTLTAASRELRRASFYFGVLALGLFAPAFLVEWALGIAAEQMTPGELGAAMESNLLTWVQLVGLLSALGLIVISLETRNVASVLIGARLTGEPLAVRQAVQRSRDIFWRTLGATLLVNVPLLAVEVVASERIAPAFGTGTEITVVSAALLTAVLFAPLTYAIVAITLGDAGVRTSLRRSIGLFRARPFLAVLIAVLAACAQLLLLLALGAGLELVLGAAGIFGIGTASDATGLALGTVGVVVFTFAVGTLASTVAALAVAPQATAFVALTAGAPAIDRIRRREQRIIDPVWPLSRDEPRFRWLTRPMLIAFAIGALAVAAGVSSLAS